jgi:hypothetical protein
MVCPVLQQHSAHLQASAGGTHVQGRGPAQIILSIHVGAQLDQCGSGVDAPPDSRDMKPRLSDLVPVARRYAKFIDQLPNLCRLVVLRQGLPNNQTG